MFDRWNSGIGEISPPDLRGAYSGPPQTWPAPWLDADAFSAFEETGNVFDKAMADRLRENIYAAGGSRDPEELYTAFRGKMPSPDAMMVKRGLA